MRILPWRLRKKGREKKKRRRDEKEKREKYERMPDFKKMFSSLPNIVESTISKSRDIEPEHVPTAQDRTAAKRVVEQEARAASSRQNVDDIYGRIETATSKNLEIVWLLQKDEDVPFNSLSELIENYRNEQDRDSIKGISVNYVFEGTLHQISTLDEQDLDSLAKKLERRK